MATEKIVMGINMRQSKNKKSSTYGKYYPEVDQLRTLSLRGFAQHMSDHGSDYKRSTVEGVLRQIVECLPELLAQGVPVKLDGLGTFYPTAEVVKGAGLEQISEMEGLDPGSIVKAIHIRFLPESTRLDNLCGPQFKKTCALELRNIVSTEEVTIDGKKRKVKTLKPVATAVAETRSSGGSSSGSNSGGGSNDDPEIERP